MLEHRPPNVRAIAVDLPELAYDAPGTTLEELEAQLDDYLDARLSGIPVTLTGHSFGAWLVARNLSRRRESICRAILVAGVVSLPPEAAMAYAQLADEIEGGRTPLEPTLEGILRRSFGAALTPELLRAGMEMLSRYSPARFARTLRLVSSIGRPGLEVRPYAVPTVIVQASDDPIVPRSSAEGLARLGGRNTLELWEGDCHMLPMIEPKELADSSSAEPRAHPNGRYRCRVPSPYARPYTGKGRTYA